MDFFVISMGKGEAFANIVYLFVPYFSRGKGEAFANIVYLFVPCFSRGKGEAFANIVYLFVPYFSRANASPLHKIKREWEEAYQKPEISHSTFTAVAFRNIYKYCQVIWGVM
jgi:hypothetical protein